MISQSLRLCPAFSREEPEASACYKHAPPNNEQYDDRSAISPDRFDLFQDPQVPDSRRESGLSDTDLSPSLRLTPPCLYTEQDTNLASHQQHHVTSFSPSLRLDPLALRLGASLRSTHEAQDEPPVPIHRSQRLEPHGLEALLEASPSSDNSEAVNAEGCTQSLPLLPAFARQSKLELLQKSLDPGVVSPLLEPVASTRRETPRSTQMSPQRSPLGLLVATPILSHSLQPEASLGLRKSDFLSNSPAQDSSQSSGDRTLPLDPPETKPISRRSGSDAHAEDFELNYAREAKRGGSNEDLDLNATLNHPLNVKGKSSSGVEKAREFHRKKRDGGKIRKRKSVPLMNSRGGWRMTIRAKKAKKDLVQSTLDLFSR